jgi:hypothetical protein
MLGDNGPLARVRWFDAVNERGANKISLKDPSEHLSYCETIGEITSSDECATVITYHYTDCDGTDFICLPSSWIVEIQELEWKDKELDPSENLVSPQE